MKKNYTQTECKAIWESIKGNRPTVEEIDEIDSKTPWSEVEPRWWLEMMQIRNEIMQNKENT